MSESSVRIAVSIKDRTARQLVCSLFSTAGASVQVCDGIAAISQAGDDLQAIVLWLSTAPEETFDSLVLLRQRVPGVPVFVVMDAAGEHYGKRAATFGAAQVIPLGLLERRVAHLVKQLAHVGAGEDWSAHSSGSTAGNTHQGYEIQSMDLGAWLAIPGNRRLLGMQEPGTAASAAAALPNAGPVPQGEHPGAGQTMSQTMSQTMAVQSPSSPPVSELEWIATPPPVPTPEPSTAPQAADDGAPCGLGDCRFLIECRAQHEAQNAAILEAHKQRERRQQEQNQSFRERLQAELRSELHQALIQELAAAEVRGQARLDAFLAKVRLERSAALQRINLILGVLGGLIVLVVLAGIGFAWRFGGW